ncbi:MAG TPA: YdcF family protein [Gaiellaceae bacterium]
MARRLLLVAAGLVAAWVVACLVFFTWSPWDSGPPAHADVVVMLSGSTRRLPTALSLIRRGIAPVLALSSVQRTKHWREADRLCRVRRYAGARVVCFDAVPFSTRGEARTVARLARQRGWRSIVVVTSRFHITRAHMLFRRCWHGPLSMVGAPSTWWQLPVEWVSETGKLLVQVTAERGC